LPDSSDEVPVTIAPGGRYSTKWISSRIDCSGETLLGWLRQAERDGMTTEDRARMKALEGENCELKQANEILRKVSAYFAQLEPDRTFRKSQIANRNW